MKELKRILSFVLCLVMVLGMLPAGILTASAAGESTIVIAGSDFQSSSSASTMQSIVTQIKEDYTSIDGILMAGDYNGGYTTYSSANEVAAMDTAVTNAGVPTDADRVYIQGNHDYQLTPGSGNLLSTTGEHDTDAYGVYVINYNDFGSASSGLKTYLDAKVAAGYSKPVFVVTHQPLHASSRGDNTKAVNIFNVLNAAGGQGLNIIFLFGHNHSSTYDDYLGNAAIYLDEGSSITVAGGSTSTLNFTYMNAGYVGFVNSQTDSTLTMSVFEITDDQVTVRRYDANGEHVLKARGVSSSSTYPADTTIVQSGATIALTTPVADDTGSDDSTGSGSTGSGNVYELDTDGVTTGEDYLIVSAGADGTAYALRNDNGTISSAEVTISDGQIITDASDIVWTFEDSANLSNNGQNLYVTDGSIKMTTETSKTLNITSDGTAGAYTVKRADYSHYLTYDNGWGYSNSGSDNVYFFVNTGETVAPSVTPEAKDWVTITEPVEADTRYQYVLDTDGTVDTGVEYLIISDDEALALSAAASSDNSVSVELEGNYAYADSEDYGWTFTQYSSGVYYIRLNGSTYLNLSNGSIGSSSSTGSSRRWTVEHDSNGAYNITQSSSNGYFGSTTYYLRYSGSNSKFQAGTTETPVRLYKYVGEDEVEAQDGLYAKLDGELEYIVARGADEDTALAAVMDGIDVLTSTSADGSNAYPLEDSDTNIVWELASNYDGNVPGEYAVKITYKDQYLGTVKVIVPDTAIVCDDVLHYLENGTTVDIAADVTAGTPEGTYTYEVLDDADGIITDIDEFGTIYFSGTEGTAQVKITYTMDDGSTLEKVINVTASKPHYTLDLHENKDGVLGEEITAPIAIKGVEQGDTYGVWAVIKQFNAANPEGKDLEDVEDSMIEWTSSDESVATVDPATGVITFTGKDGTVNITATYQDGNRPSDTITISATASKYTVPADGTTDFPEYPNEGAIRYDKTATAVGNFSETGIAQIELSMTGVPYTTGSEIDVVLMLDRSTSMRNGDRVSATVAAAKAFVEGIVKNEDGSYNGNRIYIGYFMGYDETYDITDSGNIGGSFTTVDSDEEFDALMDSIENDFTVQTSTHGTDWQAGLEKCQTLLNTAKTDGIGNDRQQFCVFMSDGAPTDYKAVNGTSYSMYNVTWVENNTRNSSYKYEYYSTEMKNDGVTVYSVLLGDGDEQTEAECLMNDVAGPAGETTRDTGSTLSKQDQYYFSVSDANANDMESVFQGIAQSIMQAATDVVVEDQITDHYTMIFDIPEGHQDITGVTNDFYIEFVKYTLDETTHERTDTVESVTKLYLKNTNDVLSAASDANGTAYAAPVFEQKVLGDKGTLMFWTTDSSKAAKSAMSYNDGTNTYYFIPYGQEINADGTIPEGWYNMTSGAYAYGTVDSTNMSTDLVIATPYFVYNASTKMLYWTLDKMQDSTTEYALRYFVYLNNSATEVGEPDETDPGSYLTNDHAYLTYTNFQGNDCRVEFPKPQLTWSGAQVSYVFYLVNAQGQPINKSGQVVDFANATFVTDIYTESVVWNKGADGQIVGDNELDIDWLAAKLLPSDYKVYDEQAQYQLHVYGDHTGKSIFDYFTIGGNDAANISSSLNNRVEGANTTESTVSLTTTKVYNTKAGEKITGYGTYTSEATSELNNEIVLEGFDFYNTTVAFAVVWQPSLAPDTVVVDYGLDVLINVTFNDLMQDNKISGIGLGKEAYGDTAMNTGLVTDSKLGTTDQTTADGSTIHIENDTQIRFSQNDMTFNDAVTFYYESAAEYYEGSEQKTGYLYTSVTVIPATTIYYEDSFVDLTVWDMDDNQLNEEWAVEGTVTNGTQDQDRPGSTLITGVLDADNVYGYDSAYDDCSLYSMGSSRKVTVNSDKYAEAQFTFYGTGFDVISLTSNTTGTISVDVYNAAEFEQKEYDATVVKSAMVDTYYGYTKDGENWVVDENADNALYQIPVMKVSDLPYDKYTVVITVAYLKGFDHTSAGSLDFYLDAIRIYDPTGNEDETSNKAYLEDNEAWPVYQELRKSVIESADQVGEIAGAVYIDGQDGVYVAADYSSYGPNNELYLAPGDAIAFTMNLDSYLSKLASLQIGLKSANGETVSYHIINAADIEDQTDVSSLTATTLATSTDMYYDITDLKDSTIVIFNSSENGAILSITNLKATFTEDPGEVTINFGTIEEDALDTLLTAMAAEPDTDTGSSGGTEGDDSGSAGEDTDNSGSGLGAVIGQIIDLLKKLFGWG